ncbi:26S proteasome non-ATPase regulatory subunit [Dirofilaria immitis]
MVEEKSEMTSDKKSTATKKSVMDDKEKKNGKEEKKEKDEMTEEDIKLKEDLEMLVQRLNESDLSLYQPTLETMRSIIRASTTSMTSVPKPLKFMRPHYATIKEIHKKMMEGPTKKLCADIISVLAMTSDDKNDCINYRMMGKHEPIGDWGHEYVRHLAMEMAEEWRSYGDGTDAHNKRREQLLTLTREIVLHNMKHNAEVEACDLLIEIERLDLLSEYVEEVDHGRVCLYLLSCSPLMPDPDNEILIKAAMNIYRKFGKNFDALRCAIMLNAVPTMREIVLSTKDILEQKQMAVLLGRHQIFLELEGVENGDKLMELNSNANLHTYFHSLARELDIMEPKTPEGIYKSHLEQSRPFAGSSTSDSVRSNLAAAFVNGFVNTGFGVDKMMTEAEDASRWFYKNKEYGMLSAAASQGLVWRWDIDTGLAQCDRFLYVNDDFIKAGTLLAIGIISSGIQDTCDPAAALLMDHINSDRTVMRIGSIFGLGLAYANSKRLAVLKKEDGGVVFELKKLLLDTKPSATSEVKGLAALSIGFILVGTCDHITACELFNYLNEKTAVELQDSNYRFVALGIALIFLGAQQKSEVFVEMVRALPDPFGTMFSTLIDVCAYAGTGNVLKIQKLLHICSEHYETKETKEAKKKISKDDKNDTKKEGDASSEKPDYSTQQAVAVLGIGLIAMGEEIGAQMSLRMFGHLIRYGEPVIRRAVPLALALITHNAIFAMGLVGAGTNNARLVSMLRQLASYHHKDQVSLMLVRLAQGMTHMGKGTMTLNPFHSDRQLMCPAAVAGLLTICYAFLEANNSVLNNRQHYLLYSLTLAMQPRLLITLIEDEMNPDNLKQINVSVRVGQAVDVVAQAGKPKTITGFQTHTTPVLMAYGERAELANEEYISLTPYLEGLVILKKNPAYEASAAEIKKK